MTTPQRTWAGLAALFDLHPTGTDVWTGPDDGVQLPQLFGGQLVAQSLVAGGRSTPDGFLPHSIHTSFLRTGLSGVPVEYRVERLRDGRQFATREVSAWQNGDRLVCRSIVSCTSVDEGLTHSRPAPPTAGVDAATDLHVLAEADGGLGEYWDDFSSIEVRVESRPDSDVSTVAAPPENIWMRSVDPLGDDPLLHRAAIAYASDLMLMSTALTPHGHTTGHETTLARDWWGVSLDHTMWFQRHVRADDWLLYEHSTAAGHDSRALIDASVFDADGNHAVRITQEALVRTNRTAEETSP